MKQYHIKVIAISMLLTIRSMSFAQVEGFWHVKNVSAGDREVTPVAKWFKINKDHTQQMGNGWLQNGEGTWTFDTETSLFSPINFNDIKDEFGSFRVAFKNERMIWEREEEGMLVKVVLEPITALPKGPADEIKGLWGIVKVLKDGIVITDQYDPDNKRHLFIQWDNRFQDNLGPDGRLVGFWQMNAHKPIISFIRSENLDQQFFVKFGENTIELRGHSENEKGLIITLNRLSTFPE